MNNTSSKVLIFAAGAAAGSLVTWRILKTRYDRLMEAEVASFEETLNNMYNNEQDESEGMSEESDEEDPDLCEPDENPGSYHDTYERTVKDLGYSNTEVKGMVKPVVISPNEFGELEGYEIITLAYFSDGVLTDELDVPVEDVEGTVGRESLTTFGEYEDDAVHVRNDRLHAYYEILFDMRSYHDDVKPKHLTEGE